MEEDTPAGQGIYLNDGNVRFSNSPRRWAKLQQSLHSPTKSVHVHPEFEVMKPRHESIHDQADDGLRTADFFDDSTDDEGRSSPVRKRLPPSGQSGVSQCMPRASTIPHASSLYEDDPRYSGLEPPTDRQSRVTSGSFVGSVEEFLPQTEYHNRSQSDTPRPFRPPRPARSMSFNVSDKQSFQGVSQMPRPPRPARPSFSQRSPVSGNGWQGRPHQQNYARMSVYSDKIEHVLGVHAIAHDYLLRGMMNDPQLAGSNLQQLDGVRASLLPPALRTNDPRSPRFQIPEDPAIARSASERSANSKKRVHMVPPPINTDRHHLPENIVRTPYPFSFANIHRRTFGQEPPSAMEPPVGASESILTLSIRRSNPYSRQRVSTLTIPASNNFSAVRKNEKGEDETHVQTSHFDDEEFFRQLRTSYKSLCGPLRFFSARTLICIVVSGPAASQVSDAGYGWHHQLRSPRALAYKGLTDTFSEGQILQHFYKPTAGKGRYTFVHWAHRLAAAPPSNLRSPTPTGCSDPEQSPCFELVRKLEQPEGLEFVVSWSWRRISPALLLVLLLGIAAALLWIFLGKSTALPWASAGFRNAGDCVGTGVVLGIMVLLIGLTSIAGWLGVSWLVM